MHGCFAWTDVVGLVDGLSQPPDVQLLPAMLRRRMSRLSRLLVASALQCLDGRRPDYSVFCSRHGELDRTVGLLDSLAAGTDLSPAAFSQSVHNTSAGLQSIATGSQAPFTAIAAGEDSFAMGLLDAWAYLQEHPDCQVLLVVGDEPVPAVLRDTGLSSEPSYAVALLLGRWQELSVASDGFSVTRKRVRHVVAPFPQALTFAQFWWSRAATASHSNGGFSWEWRRESS